MFETYSLEWPTVGAGLLTATTVVLVSVATGGFVVVPVIGLLDPTAGVTLSFAFVFGPVATVGVGAGVLAAGVFQSTLSWWTALDALGYCVLAYLGYRLWGVLPVVSTGDPPLLRTAGQWLEFAAVTFLTSGIAALALAWGTLLLWESTFHAVVLPELTTILVSTWVLTPIIVLPTTTLLAEPLPSYRQRPQIALGEGAFWGGIVAPLLWLFGGTALSLLSGGRRIQLLAGAIVLSLLIASYRPRRDRSDNRSPPQTHETDTHAP